jgi:hypothetical protein
MARHGSPIVPGRTEVQTVESARQERDPEDLVSVAEVAETLGIGESTVWLFVRRHNLPRYRVPARGKTTLFKWGNVLEAYHTPRAVAPQERDTKKAAA